MACTTNNISNRVESEVIAYKKCTNQTSFKKWLFDIESENNWVNDDGVLYKVIRTYDPTTHEVGLMIEIKDGVADYHINEVLDELKRKIEKSLEKYSLVQSVYIADYGCVLIRLKNERNFNNVDN